MLAIRGEGLEGRIASAGRAAANVFRHSGLRCCRTNCEAVTESLANSDPTGIARAIQTAMESLNEAPATDPVAPLAIRLRPSVSFAARRCRAGGRPRRPHWRIDRRNAIGHIAMLAREGDNALAEAIVSEYGKLDRLVDGLQRAVLELRILPLRRVFQRFSPLVREMSRSLAKPVRLVIEGEETQADKAIVEMLFEPLLHVVRNAMDHGVRV